MGHLLRTIVAAVDFSETSQAAWSVACRLAMETDSRVHLLHVSPDPLSQPWTVEAIGVDFPAIAEAWQQQARLRLAAIAPAAGLSEDRITRAVVIGVPHVAIVEYAATHHADLIVVGTHGYGPIKHLLLGSVVERVLRHASCPVMTVPPQVALTPETAVPPPATT
jgi:nucleotide-binding universal stress UspA family protein